MNTLINYIVSNATGQSAKSFHLARLIELFFELTTSFLRPFTLSDFLLELGIHHQQLGGPFLDMRFKTIMSLL